MASCATRGHDMGPQRRNIDAIFINDAAIPFQHMGDQGAIFFTQE